MWPLWPNASPFDIVMVIRHLETWQVDLPLTRPYTIAFKTVDTVSLHVVRLATECGRIGLGSAAPTDVTGETAVSCSDAIETSGRDLLVGYSLDDGNMLACRIRQRLAAHPSACAALDIAVHDLLARAADKPLADYLGRCHRGLPTSITIGILPAAETLREADEYIGRGFSCLKVKLGHDASEDAERLRLLRHHVGASVHIRVDANQGYNWEETKALVELASYLGIELIEQPMPPGSGGALRALTGPRGSLFAADESLHTEDDAKRLSGNSGPYDVFNIKLMKCGGVLAARSIARTAHDANIAVMWGCMDESVVSVAAALHTAYASRATRYLDLDGSFDLSGDVATGGFRLDNGRLFTLDAPGLGVRLND